MCNGQMEYINILKGGIMRISKAVLLGILMVLLSCSGIKAQEIFEAVMDNDLVKVKALIEKDTSIINVKDNAGNTLLHNAAIAGSAVIAELLISKGADINSKNSQQNAPLHESLINGKNEVAKLLIEKGCELQGQNSEGKTPVHYAARYNCLPVLKILISKKVNLEVREKNRNQTPLLYLALMTDYAEAAKMLIEGGADVNAQDRDGATALDYAIHNGSNNLIKLFEK